MNVIIVGAGFAGIQAAHSLRSLKKKYPDASVAVYDTNPYTTMLPALPEIVSGAMGSACAVGAIPALLPPGVAFRRETITRIDLHKRTVFTAASTEQYDRLVLACGSSKADLHGFDQSVASVHTLDSLESAFRMGCALGEYLTRAASPVCIIAGGSYTGVELACAVYRLGLRCGKPIELVIVEAGSELLSLLDAKTRQITNEHIKGLGFKTITSARVAAFNGTDVGLSTGELYKNAFLCWCAGTKRAIEDIQGDFESLPDKRIKVNEFLQLANHPDVFVPPDTGAVLHKGAYLRKAVNFAFYGGKCAGDNILRSIGRRALRKFVPMDLGEVLPLYQTSAGRVLGFLTGTTGLRLHYFMTGYRNYNAANRLAFFSRALAPFD